MVPKNLTGDTLYPLNKLKIYFPDIYQTQVQKYLGREKLMQYQLPLLNCLWNDVLHFSPIHPSQIRNAFLNAGLNWQPRQWFIVNSQNSIFLQSQAIIFVNNPPLETPQWGEFKFTATDFIPFSDERLNSLTTIPIATVNYLKLAKQIGEQPFIFRHVSHILYKGSINVCDLEIINV